MKQTAIVLVILLFLGGCVYYNTFYHAEKSYNTAEASRKKSKQDQAGGAEKKNYEDAIKKCSKILSEYPKSKYVDDALFIIGKSYYYLGEYQKAERKFRELLSAYPESEFVSESRFFLGKTRYRMGNYLLAIEVFEEFMQQDKDDRWRAEAIYFTGEIYYEEERREEAIAYYDQFISSYESDYRTPEVRYRIGELYFELERYDSAAVAFAEAVAVAADPLEKFQALYQQGVSLYRLDSLTAGRALFAALAENEEYSLQQGKIRLRIAEGYYLAGDVQEAVRQYDEITTDFIKTEPEGEAYYQIGLIVQDDYDDLETAKEMFDFAARATRGGEFRQLAQEKSAQIAKIKEYRDNLDAEDLESAILSQFLLGELYCLTLNRPDSAMNEYCGLVESFPGSDLAPRALLAIGWLYEDHYQDTAAATAAYRRVIEEYPYSDEYAAALSLLDLYDSEYDSLYADKLYQLAEEQYFDYQNPDSALVLFELLRYRFPDSRLVPKAEYAAAMIGLELYEPKQAPPEDSTYVDSTMIWVFQELSEKYSGTPLGKEAARLASGEAKEKPRQQTTKKEEESADTTSELTGEEMAAEPEDTLSEMQRQELALQKLIEELPLAPEKPTLQGEFEYPISAYGTQWEGRLLTKIKIEFDGKVTEVELLHHSDNDEIDKEVERVLLETEFDPMEIDPLHIGGYFIYYYQVVLPDVLRNR